MNAFNNKEEMLNFINKYLIKDEKIVPSRFNESWFKNHNFCQQWLILNRIKNHFKFSSQELAFRLLHNIDFGKKFYCAICNSEVKFDSRRKLFPRFCSLKCSANSPEVREKTRKTSIERYGCVCSFQSEEVKEKIRATWKEHYGVDNPNRSEKVKAKTKATCIEKYGVDHPAKTKEFQEKRVQYWIDNFGVINNSQLSDWKEKVKNTCLERYGCEHSSASNIIKEKIRNTYLERYGYDNPNKCKEIRAKSAKTLQEKYKIENVTNPGQIPEVKEKIRASMKKHYGCDHAFQANEVKEKIKETCKKKYGCDHAFQAEEIKEKAYTTKKKRGTFGKSKEEDIIYQKLQEKFNSVERQYKSKLYPWYCDFYIASKDLYIEYQGFWTHGEEPYDSTNLKHQEKVKEWLLKSEEMNFKGKKKYHFKTAINNWTVSDPEKRAWVKEHNLNWLEFFTIEQFENWFSAI